MGEYCNCQSPEQCQYGKHGRSFDICRGHDEAGNEVLTADRRAAYRDLWQQQSAGNGAPVPPAITCTRLGEVVRQTGCPTCRGQVLLKIFACPLHTECTLMRSLEGLACCAKCSDRVPGPI